MDVNELNIQVLDLRGLNCPLPVLKTQKALRNIVSKEALWVETTDPLASIDIPTLCENDGHELKTKEQADGYQRFLIIKA